MCSVIPRQQKPPSVYQYRLRYLQPSARCCVGANTEAPQWPARRIADCRSGSSPVRHAFCLVVHLFACLQFEDPRDASTASSEPIPHSRGFCSRLGREAESGLHRRMGNMSRLCDATIVGAPARGTGWLVTTDDDVCEGAALAQAKTLFCRSSRCPSILSVGAKRESTPRGNVSPEGQSPEMTNMNSFESK